MQLLKTLKPAHKVLTNDMSSDDIFEKHIEVNDVDLSAVDLLSTASHLSKQIIKQAMSKGAVWLTRGKYTQRLRRARRTLKPNDVLHLYYNAKILAIEPAEAILICDEGEYSVWYKPCGLLSQGSKWSDHCTITRWAAQYLQPERPAFIVHRLDRAATGLILVAHTKKTTSALTKLFAQRAIHKQYQAIVTGQFPTTPEIQTFDSPIDERSAISHVQLIQYSSPNNRSLLSVKIETGRKHQIRRHLSEAGYPIIGDRLYGEDKTPSTDLQLTAVSLGFICPITGKSRLYELDMQLRPQL